MKYFILILFLCSYVMVNGQIQGLSASKLSTYHVTTVEKGSAEFEPTFSSSFAKIADSDSIQVSSSINWRMTLGLLDNVELGLNFPSNISNGSASIKTALVKREKFQLGAFGGVTVPLGNRNVSTTSASINDIGTYGLGLVGTYEIDSLNSFDLNFQFSDFFYTAMEPTGRSYYININYGTYSISDKVLVTAGAGYSTFKDYWNANLFVEYGVAFEWTPTWALLLSGFNTIWERNSGSMHGFNIAFTTFW